MVKYKAAIVGLGQVGLSFDRDTKRTGIWTHFSAFTRLVDRYELVAVCDVSSARLDEATSRCAALRTYACIDDLLGCESLDVVSICTPPRFHGEQIIKCAGKVRAIICEKPLCEDIWQGEEVIHTCLSQGTLLAVNYYKRYDGCIPHVRERIQSGAVGTIRTVTAWYAGPLDAVGSHMIDLLRFILGDISLQKVTALGREHYTAVFISDKGILVEMNSTGPREDFIFEVDILGSGGRIRILDNCTHAEFYRFQESQQYTGYRELFLEPARSYVTNDRFLPLFLEIADRLDNGVQGPLLSDGLNALETQRILSEINTHLEKQV